MGIRLVGPDGGRHRGAVSARALVVAVVAVVAAVLALPVMAAAQAADCPIGPTDQEIAAADPADREPLRLRRAVADSCEAQVDRLDLLDSAGGLPVAATLAGEPAVDLAEGATVEVSNPADETAVVEATEQVVGTLHADLWSLMGGAAAMLLLVVVWRAVRP